MWGFKLTPLQLETRGLLEELILKVVLKRFPAKSSEDDLRTAVCYTITLSWLILRALAEQYGADRDNDPGF